MYFASKSIPSNALYTQCMNQGEPSSKTKYVIATDSELVP